ncbi:hypothetical protein FALCPG4_000227 [Fusarium falciforme]
MGCLGSFFYSCKQKQKQKQRQTVERAAAWTWTAPGDKDLQFIGHLLCLHTHHFHPFVFPPPPASSIPQHPLLFFPQNLAVLSGPQGFFNGSCVIIAAPIAPSTILF